MTTTSAVTPKPSRRRLTWLTQLAHDDARRRRMLLLIGLLAFGIVAGLAALSRLYTVLPFDVWFTRELQENQWALIARLMYGVSIFGYQPWALLTLVAGMLLVSIAIGWRDGLYFLALTVVQGLVNVGIKLAIGRPRPVSGVVDVFVPEQGNSFPSGHVMFYTVFFGMLLFFTLSHWPRSNLRNLCAALFAALIGLIGPSRIILGAHWLSDVIAAYLLGLIILACGIELYLTVIVKPQAPDSRAHEKSLLSADERR